jgi:phospholipid/cholesterol/gamma-HCH transport system substrate-binding protein
MSKKLRMEIGLGLLILTGAVLMAYMAIKVKSIDIGKAVTFHCLFDNASGIVKDSAVMVAGVKVGTVGKISVDFDKAKMTLRIDPAAQIRNDATAIIRSKGLLGEKFVEIAPKSKTAPLLEDGGRIENTITPMEIDQVIGEIGPILASMESDMEPIGKSLHKVAAALATAIEENEGELGPMMKDMRELLGTFNHAVTKNDARLSPIIANMDRLLADSRYIVAGRRNDIAQIITNMNGITQEISDHYLSLTQEMKTLISNMSEASNSFPGAAKNLDQVSVKMTETIDMLNVILAKLQKVDAKEIRKLLQEEGVTINIGSY